MKRLDVGMVLGFGQDLGNDLALLGDAQALFGAQRFDVDGTCHGGPIVEQIAGRFKAQRVIGR